MERKLVDWTCGRIGFAAGDGVFTSGGTQSNLQALLLAREAAIAAPSRPGPRRHLRRLVIVATASSHFSVQKSARLLGLGDDAVLLVRTDARGRMDPAALAGALDTLAAIDRVAMCVVATAGTTDRGCLDPLAADRRRVRPRGRVAARRRRVRVRAAGLADAPAPAGRHRAGPVGHGRLPQELLPAGVVERGAGARAARTCAHVTWHADYLNPRGREEPNQVDKSLQTTRRFDALKLWTTLRALGADGIGRDVRRACSTWPRRCTTRSTATPTSSWSVARELSTVLFRYQPVDVTDEQADRLVPLVRRVLFESGRARRRQDRGGRAAVPQAHAAQPRDDARRRARGARPGPRRGCGAGRGRRPGRRGGGGCAAMSTGPRRRRHRHRTVQPGARRA